MKYQRFTPSACKDIGLKQFCLRGLFPTIQICQCVFNYGPESKTKKTKSYDLNVNFSFNSVHYLN